MPSIASGPCSLRAQLETSLGERLCSTLLLRHGTAPATVRTGIAAIDALTGGLPRGALSEIAGPSSSGRTGVMLSALAAATRRQEVCALVDASDSFDPASAALAGIALERLLWVRCNSQARSAKLYRAGVKMPGISPPNFAYGGALEQVLKVSDLLLQAGGFAMVVLDLGDIPMESARRVPLTSWFRFRRAVEHTATVLLLIEQEPCAKTCASLVLQLQSEAVLASNASSAGAGTAKIECDFSSSATRQFEAGACASVLVPPKAVVSHASLLRGMRFHAEVVRSWAQRKPPQSAGAYFELRTTEPSALGNQHSAG